MELPREFYKQRKHEITRLILAEEYHGIVFITLSRGQKQVTVQFKVEEFGSDVDVFGMLSEIAKYPKSIRWERDAGNWCYISRSKKRGHLVFTQRHKEPDKYKLKEQPWARLIPEEEIEFEELGPMDFRYGKWRGREVDVYRIWMDSDIHFLDRAMKAYRRLQDENLSYDLLGHVIDSTGNIVGLMTEPMIGRLIEPHDAPLMFTSLRKLNSIGYILDAPFQGSMLITPQGDLRITAMHNVIQLPEGEAERERRIRSREEWCKRLVLGEAHTKGKCVCPIKRGPAFTRGKLVFPVHVLMPMNDPERVLSLCGDVGAEERLKWGVEWFKDPFSSPSKNGDVPAELWRLVRAGGVKRLLEAVSSDEEEEERNETAHHVGHRRPMKKLKGAEKWEKERSETPLPRLPVAFEDLPLMPPSVFDFHEDGRERSMSQTVYGGSVTSSPTIRSSPPGGMGMPAFANTMKSSLPSWLLEGDWLELASTSRFEVVD